MLLASLEVTDFYRFYLVVLKVCRCDPHEQRPTDYVNYAISQSAATTSRNLAVKGHLDSPLGYRTNKRRSAGTSRYLPVLKDAYDEYHKRYATRTAWAPVGHDVNSISVSFG